MKKSELKRIICEEMYEILNEYSEARGVNNVKRGDKFKVIKGLKLNMGGYNNMLGVSKDKIIEFEYEHGDWDVKTFFKYNGKSGYLESSLKSILDDGELKRL